jgi:predicted ATPase/DNA-binding CsgD family transcriptional regulator
VRGGCKHRTVGARSRTQAGASNREPGDRSGRERELRQASEALGDGGARLLTFTGPAGVGKSWAAAELGRRLVAERGWRTVTVPVDGAPGFTELMSAVAEEIGTPDGGGALGDRLAVALAGAARLLLLDGCEALRVSPHPVAQLLELAPSLRVVATSLGPLGVDGEHVVGLDPFAVPPVAAGPEELRDCAAVRFFCRTAADVAGFEPEPADVSAIAELCRRVHGLPLAIEIMARRVGEQSPAAMVEELDRGHECCLERTRTHGEPRHISLSSALGWSHAMLDPAAARLLRRMSVFTAPATLAMLATAVPEDDCGTHSGQLPRAIATLVGHRLAERDPGPGEPAFRIVDLVRDFAAERLVEEGELAAAENAHTRAVLAFTLARSAAADIAEDDLAQRELARADPDLRSALRRLCGRGDVEDGLLLASALAPFVLRRGYDGFVRAALTGLLRRASESTVDRALLARAELWKARLVAHFDGPDAAEEVNSALAAGLRHGRASADRDTVLLGLGFVMETFPTTGDLAAAASAAVEAVPLAEATGDRRWVARFHAWAGMVAHRAGRTDEAFDLALRGVRWVESNRDPRAQLLLTLLLAALPEYRAAPLMARLPPIGELVRTARRLDDARYEPSLLLAAAGLALWNGDLRTAATRCAECLRVTHRQGAWQILPFAVLLLTLVAAEIGDLSEAARFHGMLRTRLDLLQLVTPREWLSVYVLRMDDVRARLGEETFESHAARGERDMRAHALGVVLAYADRVARVRRTGQPGPRAGHFPDLTPRELQVLTELVTGATYKEISRRLGMSPKTVMHHSGAIYRKLGVRGRAEATAWAFRNGLAD